MNAYWNAWINCLDRTILRHYNQITRQVIWLGEGELENKGRRDLEWYFAINVKSRQDQWRIIEPLDENKEPYVPCNIDEISLNVRIVEITEVSKHYE